MTSRIVKLMHIRNGSIYNSIMSLFSCLRHRRRYLPLHKEERECSITCDPRRTTMETNERNDDVEKARVLRKYVTCRWNVLMRNDIISSAKFAHWNFRRSRIDCGIFRIVSAISCQIRSWYEVDLCVSIPRRYFENSSSFVQETTVRAKCELETKDRK